MLVGMTLPPKATQCNGLKNQRYVVRAKFGKAALTKTKL